MKRYGVIALVLWVCVLSGAAALAGTGRIYLAPVQAHPLRDGAEVLLKFQSRDGQVPSLDNRSLTFGEGWVQLEIPGAYINPSKQSVRLDKGPVAEVFTYQFQEETVRLRLYARALKENLQKRIQFHQNSDGTFVLAVAAPVTANGIASPKTKTREHVKPVPQSEPVEGEASFAPESRVLPISMNLPETESAPQKVETLTAPEGALTPSVRERQEQKPAPIIVGTATPDLLFSSLKMIAALGLVLALMLGCFYLFKRTLGHKIGLSGKDRLIRVVSSAYIGPKKSIALVEVSGETLVLGIAGDQITLLSKMISADDQASSRRETSEGKPLSAIKSFEGHLKDANGKVISGDDLWSTNEA